MSEYDSLEEYDYHMNKYKDEHGLPLCQDCGDEGWVYWSETGQEHDPSDPTGMTGMPVEVPMRAPCPNGCKPPAPAKEI